MLVDSAVHSAVGMRAGFAVTGSTIGAATVWSREVSRAMWFSSVKMGSVRRDDDRAPWQSERDCSTSKPRQGSNPTHRHSQNRPRLPRAGMIERSGPGTSET